MHGLFWFNTDCSAANPPGAAGHAVEGGVPAGHVPSAAGPLGGQWLSGSQREGACDREPSQAVAEGGDERHQRAAEDPGHQQQSAGE